MGKGGEGWRRVEIWRYVVGGLVRSGEIWWGRSGETTHLVVEEYAFAYGEESRLTCATSRRLGQQPKWDAARGGGACREGA